MTRRDLLRLLLAAPIAATLDVEKLLWVPKPIVTVPAMPQWCYLTKDVTLAEYQRLFNYYSSAQMERIALRPKRPYFAIIAHQDDAIYRVIQP